MELKRNQCSLPSLDYVQPRVRYSMNPQLIRQSMNLERPSRSSLKHVALHNSQASLPTREVC
ncbi:unnamed protein product, partial [Adineta steineri]